MIRSKKRLGFLITSEYTSPHPATTTSTTKSSDVPGDLLQLSLSEVLRNNVNKPVVSNQDGRDANQQEGRDVDRDVGSEEMQSGTTDMQQLARLFEKVMDGKE